MRSVCMPKNKDQKNSEYGHFLGSVKKGLIWIEVGVIASSIINKNKIIIVIFVNLINIQQLSFSFFCWYI